MAEQESYAKPVSNLEWSIMCSSVHKTKKKENAKIYKLDTSNARVHTLRKDELTGSLAIWKKESWGVMQ